jgi:anaerobic selenocysteine-containing dehydrogenase
MTSTNRGPVSLSVRDGRQGRYLAPVNAGDRYGARPGDAPCHHPRWVLDREFIRNWTIGFDRLKERVGEYTPEWSEAITKVPAVLIQKAARLYATAKPSSIYRSVSLDTVHDSIQACRAVSILAAVTGNIGIPGGNVSVSPRGETTQNSHIFIGYDLLPADKILLRRGVTIFRCSATNSPPFRPRTCRPSVRRLPRTNPLR